jgi:hypothetical protein
MYFIKTSGWKTSSLKAYHLLPREEVLYVDNVFPKILLADVRISSKNHIPLWSIPQMFDYISAK